MEGYSGKQLSNQMSFLGLLLMGDGYNQEL